MGSGRGAKRIRGDRPFSEPPVEESFDEYWGRSDAPGDSGANSIVVPTVGVVGKPGEAGAATSFEISGEVGTNKETLSADGRRA